MVGFRAVGESKDLNLQISTQAAFLARQQLAGMQPFDACVRDRCNSSSRIIVTLSYNQFVSSMNRSGCPGESNDVSVEFANQMFIDNFNYLMNTL
jgi:hypothetical protein